MSEVQPCVTQRLHTSEATVLLRDTLVSHSGFKPGLSFCVCQILTQPSECLNRNRDSSAQATFFSPQLSNFGELLQIVASFSYLQWKWVVNYFFKSLNSSSKYLNVHLYNQVATLLFLCSMWTYLFPECSSMTIYSNPYKIFPSKVKD